MSEGNLGAASATMSAATTNNWIGVMPRAPQGGNGREMAEFLAAPATRIEIYHFVTVLNECLVALTGSIAQFRGGDGQGGVAGLEAALDELEVFKNSVRHVLRRTHEDS